MRKKELAKNTLIIFLGKISTQFLTFLLLPIYTSYLDTSDYGIIDLIITYISLIIPVITIQQEMAVFRFLVDVRNNEKKIKKIISTSFYLIVKLIFCFLLLYFILMYFVNIKYKVLIILNIIVCIFSNFFLQISRGLGKNTSFSVTSLIVGVITIILNIVFIVFLDYNASAILLSMSIANMIGAIYLFFVLKLYKYININNTDKNLNRELIKYSLPLIPNGISWWIINASDRTIISYFIGVSANGIYAISNKFPSIISNFFHIFSLSWSESASLHINDNDKDNFFTDIFNNVICVFSCLCIGLISALSLVFPLLINETYNESYLYIPILLLGSLFNCIVGVYSAVYVAKKMTKQVATTSLISAIINIIINLCLIRYIGLYAASISTTLAYGSMVIYRSLDLKKYVSIGYDWNLIGKIIFMFILSFICYYINNIYINVIWFIVVIIFSIIFNKEIIINIFNIIRRKILNN